MSLDQTVAGIAIGVSIAWIISALIAIAANVWLERQR